MTGRTPIRRGLRTAGALAAGLAALALAGCGDPAPAGDAEAGKALFVAGCTQCHVLADAATPDRPGGTVGPNLDDAFRGARQHGWKESTLRAVTLEWLALAEPPMPRDIYEGKEAEDVAAYVASVAGTTPESEVRKAEPVQPPAGVGPGEE